MDKIGRRTVVGFCGSALVLAAEPALARTTHTDQWEDVLANYVRRINGVQLASGSGACFPQPGAEHSFKQDLLKKRFGFVQCKVIVGHGVTELAPDWQQYFMWEEALTIFVSKENGVRNLTIDQIKGILDGDISTWAQLDAGEGSVEICCRSNRTHRDKLLKYIDLIGADRSKLRTLLKGMDFISSYEMLASAAVDRKNAIVFGLREIWPESLNLVAVNGVLPTDAEASVKYPIRMPVYLHVRNTDEAREIAVQYLEGVWASHTSDPVMAPRQS